MIELAVALAFVWLGMVLAISFLEAPLKFRAPDVTLRIGLGIGRLVFRALNACEVVFAVVVAVALFAGDPSRLGVIGFVFAAVALGLQLLFVRPRLTRRSNAVLAGEQPTKRSHIHHVYVVLEVVKVTALIVAGVGLFADLP